MSYVSIDDFKVIPSDFDVANFDFYNEEDVIFDSGLILDIYTEYKVYIKLNYFNDNTGELLFVEDGEDEVSFSVPIRYSSEVTPRARKIAKRILSDFNCDRDKLYAEYNDILKEIYLLAIEQIKGSKVRKPYVYA